MLNEKTKHELHELSKYITSSKKCRCCDNEIIKVEGVRARRFYCSFICYQRYSTKVKYYKNLEKSRERAKKRNSLPHTKERYKLTIDNHIAWCKSKGLTIIQYKDFGYKFLYNNPEVVETLVLGNSIKNTKLSIDEKILYKKEYYIKNREILLEKASNYRNRNKK